MKKLKLAQYWGASCGGCDVAVLDVHHHILELADRVDFVFWPIALDFKYRDVEAMPDQYIDICLFNGAIRNEENEHIARLLRQKSKILVAFGTCAHLGGIPGLANLSTRRDLFRHIYQDNPSTVNPEATVPLSTSQTALGELELPEFHRQVRTLDQVVQVDCYVPGCPPTAERIWELIEPMLDGELPPSGAVLGAADVSLCEECPRKKNEKAIGGFRSMATFVPDPEICLLEQGVICCGPATRGGCGALCLKANMPCRGCYGPPPGVTDQGTKLLSAIASVVDSRDPAEIERIMEGIEDPAGTLYRFGLPSALLSRAREKDTV
jgi:F420-non-reducing hydrogenase small subunit